MSSKERFIKLALSESDDFWDANSMSRTPSKVVGARRGGWNGRRWQVVDAFAFPKGEKCTVCKRVAREGQIVLCLKAENEVATIHKACVVTTLMDAPEDDYDTIQKRLAEGGPLFNEHHK